MAAKELFLEQRNRKSIRSRHTGLPATLARLSVGVLGVAFVAVVLIGCGGNDGGNPHADVTFSPLEPLTVVTQGDNGGKTAVASATESASPSVQPSPSPSASPTQSGDPKTAAYDAALKLFDAVPAEDCTGNNPNGKDCLNWSTTASTPALGVAAFNVGSAQGGGALMVTGLEADGQTWGLWFGTQQALYQAVSLPADMLVCAGGNGITVHESYDASSAAVDTVSDGNTVRAEQFVLTSPGSSGSGGSGWYRLSSPVEGWADAKDLSVSSLGDCSFHDALQGNGFDRG
jgi:hypothetical protein